MIALSHTPVNFVNSYNFSLPSSQFLPAKHISSQALPLAEHKGSGKNEKRRTVLVVDDVSDVTEMLSVLLTHAGYEVAAASSAQEAIALAQSHHFDMIVSDIGMPQMNGYELAQALRSQPGYEAVPMVAVTGYSMFDDRNRSLSAGFNAHVTKPIDPRAFLDLIEQL